MQRIEDKASSPFSTSLQELNASIQTGNLERATALLDDMPTEWRDRPQVLASAAIVYFQNGNSAEALVSVSAARQAGASNPGIFRLQALIYKNLGNIAAYTETLTTMIEKFPGNPFANSQLSLHHFSLNRMDEARACAAALPDTEQWQAFRLSLEYQNAIARADPVQVSVILHKIIAESPTCPALPDLTMTLKELPEADREDLIDRITTKWPDLADSLKIRRASLATKQPEHNRIEQAMTLALDGKTFEAKSLFSGLSATNKLDTELVTVFELLPPEETLRRLPIVDTGDDVVFSPKGDTGTTLLVFTGLADKAMLPIELVDRFCAAEGHSAIYLRDAGRSAYISGVPALAGNFEETLVVLAGLLEEYETRRLLCLGTSIGGFAAIRYGIRLKAEKVMGASAPTNITSDFLTCIGDNRGKLVARRLQQSFPSGDLDLKPEVVAENGQCKIDLWFGQEYPTDVKHASYLSDCPSVNQFSIPGLDRHESLAEIITGGYFQEFLKS